MKRSIKIVFVTSVVLFVFLYTKAVAASTRYVVPAKSNKYHHPSCRWAQKFRSENLASFRSAKDALAAGYIPCKVCNPPIKE
jgi:methylphosphotriester-DNA--protein-cysteine methyltransferase